MGGSGIDLSGRGWGQVAGCCDNCIEYFGSIHCVGFLEEPRNDQLLKVDSTVLSLSAGLLILLT